MITHDLVEEDMKLQRFVATPQDEKPRFNWSEFTGMHPMASLRVQHVDGERDFNLGDIADTIGGAVTDLALSRNEENIYNDDNRRMVTRLCTAVANELLEQQSREEGESPRVVALEEIGEIIERVLVRQNAHDIARSLVMRRKASSNGRKARGGAKETAKPMIKVIRRSGEVVGWNPNKIEIAIRSAFLSLGKDSSPAADLAAAVTETVAASGQEYIHIEAVQDRVQEELMRQGHYKIAEAFILYRAHRSARRAREQRVEVAPDVESQDTMIVVTKADGQSYLWDGLDLRRRIDFAMIDLDLCLPSDEIELELRRAFQREMSEGDLQKTIILNARTLIEKDADFARFAARILLTYIYEEVLGWDIVKDGIEKLPEFHRRAFKANLVRGVEIERISPRLLNYNLDRLADALEPAADLEFDYLGIQTLYDRYLIVDKTSERHRRIETPQLFWMRVAMGLFLEEKSEAEDRAVSLYNLYKSRRFCSSTPTLFNSGTLHSQLSSCYLYKVEDSIESIMQRGIAENAYLSKWAGGLGGSWTAVRGTGGYIKGTNGESQGVIPFLKLHNDQLVAVNQGGKRRGSGCAYLETWHNDIEDFLELRKNTGDERRRTHDMNTANWIPDLFMKRMESRENWTLFRANETPDLHDLFGRAFEERYCEYEAKAARGEIFGKSLPALDLWKSMLRMLFETGHPWITFKDPCNVRSPQDHTGVIHSSNLCTEITLNTGPEETAVCNLGSVILESHLDDHGEIDHVKLRETIRTAVRALDNVIDLNFYPTEAARRANQRHRPVGLGLMGLQNALYIRNTPFASEAAVEFNDEAMEAIAYYAYEASSDIAAERGAYPTFKGSKWDRGLMPLDTLNLLEEERGQSIDVPRTSRLDWDALRAKIQSQGMRNSNVLAIAPTATISNIMGSLPCIEPAYKNLFVKSNLSGDFIVLNAYLVRDLKKLGLWSQTIVDRLKYYDGELVEIDEIPQHLKEKYATAFSVHNQWLIDAAARRQKWIDQSQSVNLFLPSADMRVMSHMYRSAWHKGLKTTYYLRTLQASNIDKATVNVKKEVRGAAGDVIGHAAPEDPGTRTYSEAEKLACSIEAMRNGEICEACQ
ncbi:MAG TPA: ribonucleoside-diphosphate reductase subunit alpha [Verrucomicrobiales bacterium]|nr:ribonucleoside-diphosphate reductase subunit alpha [Verrucomicrobiales bacterium]